MTVHPSVTRAQIVVTESGGPCHLLQNLVQTRLRVLSARKQTLQVYLEDASMKAIHVSEPRRIMLGRKEGPWKKIIRMFFKSQQASSSCSGC